LNQYDQLLKKEILLILRLRNKINIRIQSEDKAKNCEKLVSHKTINDNINVTKYKNQAKKEISDEFEDIDKSNKEEAKAYKDLNSLLTQK
jgi:GTPase involved in cell partitioning and DNA repair